MIEPGRRRLRVLFVEDRAEDTDLLLLELQGAGYAVDWERVETRASMAAALDQPWDVVIADFSMPRFSGPEALALCKERDLDLPFIIASGSVSEEEAVQSLKAGAHDFIGKTNLARLCPAVARELREAAGRKARRHAERALREAEAQYRRLIESIRAIVWRCEPGTLRVTYVNAEAEIILGYGRARWLEPGFWESCLHPEDRDRAVAERHECVRRGGGQQQYRMLASDGSVLWLHDFVSALPVGGPVVELAGVTVDVSQRKKLEDQLHRGQRLEALGRLAGGISHDFNNLLGVIMGHSELALREVAADHPAHRRVFRIHEAAQRAAALTRQLLAFGRRQAQEVRVLDLNGVVTGLDDMLRRVIGEDVELLVSGARELWPVRADPTQLEQVLLNLVLNARDAMPLGGVVVVETANMTVDEVYVRSHGVGRPGDYVLLTVTDTGEGMDAETQRQIFEPFFTTKPEGRGTGLGLSMVYGIVDQSGGHIAVYSEPRRGTTFKIYLPRAVAQEVAPTANPAAATPPPRGTETVLLVEDETALRSLIREVLEQAGYNVLEARHGGEAARLADSHGGPIHLLLTDVVMPGPSGVSVVRRIAARRPDLRVLYISGHPRGVLDREGGLGEDAPFLQKPFTADTLLRTVRALLDTILQAGSEA